MDCSLPGSSVHGILQAIVLEWVAISFCRRSSRPRDRTRVSRIGGRHFNLWGWECNMQFRIILTNSHTCLHAQSLSHVWFPATPWTVPARLLRSWDFLDENTGVGCRSLFQEIYPTQGSNQYLLHLLYWQAGSLPLRHLESPAPIQFCFKGNRALRASKKIPATHKMSGRKCTKGSPDINLIWGKSSVFSSKNILLFVLLEKSETNWDICAPRPGRLAQNKPHTER